MGCFLIFCQKKQQIDTEFFVPNEGSRLYLPLAGNSNGPLIINLHGRPGGISGFARETYKTFLEEDYLIAYLDQKGSGKSGVAKDLTKPNMVQFVQDLDVVVDTLMKRFNRKSSNLLGSS